MHIRTAQLGDADALADVQVRAWKAGYRGLISDAYLDALTVDDRIGMWREFLQDPPRRSARLLAERPGRPGRIAGYVLAGGEGMDPDADRGQIYAVYVAPEDWRTGVGRTLLSAGCRHLRDAGFADAVLWVHEGNVRARAFYAAAGWRADGAGQREQVHGIEVSEVRYHRALTGPDRVTSSSDA